MKTFFPLWSDREYTNCLKGFDTSLGYSERVMRLSFHVKFMLPNFTPDDTLTIPVCSQNAHNDVHFHLDNIFSLHY